MMVFCMILYVEFVHLYSNCSFPLYKKNLRFVGLVFSMVCCLFGL